MGAPNVQRGLPQHGPLRHDTGMGWVASRLGQYADALSRRTKVCLILVESLGGSGIYLPRLQPPNVNSTPSPNGHPAPQLLTAHGMGAQLLVESKVVHELNKPRRDEPAACTVANISWTTGSTNHARLTGRV